MTPKNFPNLPLEAKDWSLRQHGPCAMGFLVGFVTEAMGKTTSLRISQAILTVVVKI